MMDFWFILPLVSLAILFWFVICNERTSSHFQKMIPAISEYNYWTMDQGLYFSHGIRWTKLPTQDEHVRALLLFRDYKALYKSRGIDLDMILSEDYKKSETQKIELF